jgi:acetyl-CoA carboxylase biotin carboxyl carrier protein
VPLDRERIQQLLEVFKASNAGEFALQEGDRYYRFVRLGAPGAGEPEIAVSTGEGDALASPPAPATAAPGTVNVTARVVGLFYRGKQAGQEPLVQVGDIVAEGQALGTIEVLRKPTIVTSPVDGEIVEIGHEDGHGVQYGDPLFVIRPG